MSKRIRIRRGEAKNFREDLMKSGELSIDTDTGTLHACYQDGKCKDLANEDEVVKGINVNGTPLTKTNGAVDIPAATSTAAGAMTPEQVNALDDAVKNVKLNGVTLAKTDGAVDIVTRDLLITRTKTETYDIEANGVPLGIPLGGVNKVAIALCKPDTVSGYGYMGTVGITTGSADVLIRSYNYNGVYLRNVAASEHPGLTCSAVHLYKKN